MAATLLACSAAGAVTHLLSPAVFREWVRVAICEAYKTRSGAIEWNYEGPAYSGALGITAYNWVHHGGLQFAANAGLATPAEQMVVARRIEGTSYVPDQDGVCRSW